VLKTTKKWLLVLPAVAFFADAEIEYTGNAGVEQLYFLQDPLHEDQRRSQISLYFEPEIYTEWNDGYDSLVFKPFYRIDQVDTERTHGDIRELVWLHVGEEWELRTGIGKVFWGQTESLHLVDVINQTDAIEAIDGEDKLGQPMVNLSLIKDWGTTSIFILPYFRERTFPGIDGRLRPELAIDTDNPIYESDDEQSNVDFALRWQHSIGDWEVGLSYFDGTSREPDFNLVLEGEEASLRPYYPQMQQVGLDVLAIVDAWLLKFEGISRDVNGDNFFAAVGGFEYTSVGVFDSRYDIGWLVEYQYDERDDTSFIISQNDLMFGSRFVFNDTAGTEILMGFVQDLDESGSLSAFVEASSRINDNWRWSFDAWFFTSDVPTDPVYAIRRDDFAQLSLEYYF
jgi:hypothetical protein